ncbi:tyrosinase family oxidase copper chaperone [Streptomyces sp. NPDC059070]|uniref:tyrosinase family oxidase copper chaperone n=1 Tax=Streptomyces sp. NPDC059070 TaxID=3346713 RepID=UPI00369C13D8
MITEDPVPLWHRLGLRRPGAGPGHWSAPATRRGVLRGLFTLTVVTFTGGTLARITAAPRAQAGPADPAGPWSDPTGELAVAAAPGLPAAFDETYRGRRIQGRTVPDGPHTQGATAQGLPPALGLPGAPPHQAHPAPATASPSAAPARFEALIDGRQLHLMRRADGTYVSSVDHYTSYATPLEAVRAAVDELGPARLSATPAHGR